MIIQILKHTPNCVFALFCVLLYLGYLQSKTRSVPKWRLAALPLAFLFLALSGVNSVHLALWCQGRSLINMNG